MSNFDDFMNGLSAPTNGSGWSFGGQGGPGHSGALGSWDVVGQGLDRANPQQSTKPNDDSAAAQGYLGDVTGAFNGVKAPALSNVSFQGPAQAADAQATNAGPSAANNIKVDPAYNQAQSAQMTALSNLAANGGRSAASDANLAQIQQQENANARGQQDAILQGANARGQGGGGAALLAQLSNSQNATNNQSARDLGVAGQQAQTALSAGQGAAGIASNMQNQSYGEQANTAAANDAVNRFNAGQGTGVSMYNANKNQGVNNATAGAYNQGQMVNNVEIPQAGFQDQMGLAGAKGGAAGQGMNYWSNKYKEDTGAQGNQMGGIAKLGTAAIGAMAASTGGKVPGSAPVPGNSTLNDFVPLKTSPGEVVVPRTLAAGGSKADIGSFVQHAPTIQQPGQNREAMLSALKNIAAKRRGA